MRNTGAIYVVGCGALTKGSLSFDAAAAIERCDVVVGYTAYINAIEKIFPGKSVVKTGMKHEVERVTQAVELAHDGHTVAVISSGDSGIYAMAGLVFEILEKLHYTLPVEVVPGIPALALCAARLGAPLMNDFGVISFSNLLTPGETIEKRLAAFLDAGVVVVIYNPVSKGRRALFERLWAVIRERRAGMWGGYVKNGGRDTEQSGVCRIADMPSDQFDMHTLIILGNEMTGVVQGRLVTRRGYRL